MFGVGFGGRLSAKATVNAEPGTVPFAIAFDPFGHLVIAEAGTNALATFDLSRNGTVSLLEPGRHRPGRDLLGHPGRVVPVRLQRGHTLRERLHLVG